MKDGSPPARGRQSYLNLAKNGCIFNMLLRISLICNSSSCKYQSCTHGRLILFAGLYLTFLLQRYLNDANQNTKFDINWRMPDDEWLRTKRSAVFAWQAAPTT